MSRLVVLPLLFVVGIASAEIRVLFFFDEMGHQLRKTYPVHSRPSQDRKSDQISPIDRGRSVVNVEQKKGTSSQQTEHLPGFARLTWKNANGTVIAQTEVPDPRVAHSPGHVLSDSASRVARLKGAWLATGPDEAFSVTISLPETLSVNLGYEEWLVYLVPQ